MGLLLFCFLLLGFSSVMEAGLTFLSRERVRQFLSEGGTRAQAVEGLLRRRGPFLISFIALQTISVVGFASLAFFE